MPQRIAEESIRRSRWTGMWSEAGQLDWWVKEPQQWLGRVRGKDGRQRWIRAVDSSSREERVTMPPITHVPETRAKRNRPTPHVRAHHRSSERPRRDLQLSDDDGRRD
jgi:hypothetical protein